MPEPRPLPRAPAVPARVPASGPSPLPGPAPARAEQLELPSLERPRDWAPTPLPEFVELVEQQLVGALERSRAGLEQRTAMAAAVAWFRRPALTRERGLELDPLAMIHAIVRARGGLADPHQARLAAAAMLAYVATEIARQPDEGPWSLAAPEPRQACTHELMRMAARLAQGEPSCAELLEAYAEILAGPQRPAATSHPPALELICTCAALAVGGAQVDEDSVDRFASAGAATAEIAWWVDELRVLLQPLDRASFEARRAGPVLRLFAEQSSFEQREALVELLDQLPRSSPCVHEFMLHSGLVGRCAEAIEAARREVHEQLAGVLRPPTTDPRALAGLRNWLVSVDALAANLYRVPDLACEGSPLVAEGPWSRLLATSYAEACERLAASPGLVGELPPVRLRAWGAAACRYDPMLAVVLYPDLDGQPEALLGVLAERLAADPDEVMVLLESVAPLWVVHEAVYGWRDALGSSGGPWADAWAAARITVAYLQRFEPAVLALVQRLADHALADPSLALDPDQRSRIEAAVDCPCPELDPPGALDTLADRRLHHPSHALQVELALIRELLLQRLDLDQELGRYLPPPSAERAANEPPGETGRPAPQPAAIEQPRQAKGRVRAWAGGISAACEQGLLELCPSTPWRRSVRLVLAGEHTGAGELGRGRIDLWAELADELGFEFVEGSFRGAVAYVQGRRLALIDDLRQDRAPYLDPRDGPPVQAALSNLVEHLQAHCAIALVDRVEATRLLARAHAAQWRDTRGEVLDAYGWWALAEALAGEPLASALVRFSSGVIACERAAALGRSLGTLAHLGAALASDDPRLARLGPVAVASLVERAIAEAQPLLTAATTPAAIRWRGRAWLERLRSSV